MRARGNAISQAGLLNFSPAAASPAASRDLSTSLDLLDRLGRLSPFLCQGKRRGGSGERIDEVIRLPRQMTGDHADDSLAGRAAVAVIHLVEGAIHSTAGWIGPHVGQVVFPTAGGEVVQDRGVLTGEAAADRMASDSGRTGGSPVTEYPPELG